MKHWNYRDIQHQSNTIVSTCDVDEAIINENTAVSAVR